MDDDRPRDLVVPSLLLLIEPDPDHSEKHNDERENETEPSEDRGPQRDRRAIKLHDAQPEETVADGLPAVVGPEGDEIDEIQQATQVSGPRKLVVAVGSVVDVRSEQASYHAERDRVYEVRAN